MEGVFKPENGVQLNLSIPKFDVPTEGEVLDRIPDIWLKTRATTLEREENPEYWQLGFESWSVFPVMFVVLCITSYIYRRRRKHRW